jgi:thymidine kinase
MLKASYLRLYIGSMFSGKTTALLTEIRRYQSICKSTIVVNNSLDKKRYNNETCTGIKSHDNQVRSGIHVDSLAELTSKPEFERADVVVIDEAQFYPDLYEFIRDSVQSPSVKKIFIVGGLCGDSELDTFGQIHQLLPLADEIIKLNAYCSQCQDGTPASFTVRNKLKNDGQILVGGKDMYQPVCRYHYLRLKSNK